MTARMAATSLTVRVWGHHIMVDCNNTTAEAIELDDAIEGPLKAYCPLVCEVVLLLRKVTNYGSPRGLAPPRRKARTESEPESKPPQVLQCRACRCSGGAAHDITLGLTLHK